MKLLAQIKPNVILNLFQDPFVSLKFVSAVILLTCTLSLKVTFAYTSPGQSTNYVNDFAGVIDDAMESSINEKLKALEASDSTQVSVVTIKSLDGDSIENFANELFREWGIGQKDKNNGVLLLLAPTERRVRIEVGYGLEGVLTDALSSQIVRNDMTPALKSSNYSLAIDLGTTSIVQAVKGEYRAVSYGSSTTQKLSPFDFIVPAMIFGTMLAAWMASTKSTWLGGLVGGVAGGAGLGAASRSYTLPLFIGLTALGSVLAGMLGWKIDQRLSKNADKINPNKGVGANSWWWGGPGGFSGGGGGGGFGGFGGGSSGGGGASGSW